MDFIDASINMAFSHPGMILAIGCSTLVAYMLTMLPLVKGRPLNAVEVGRVSRVVIYPVKSMPPLKGVTGGWCDDMGMRTNDEPSVRDRSWMVALEHGSTISLRAEPSLTHVQPSFSPSGDLLKLDAPGMPTLTISTKLTQHNSPTLEVNVWGIRGHAVHCGSEAAEWICKYLGRKGFIIVHHPSTMPGRKIHGGPYIFHDAFTKKDKVAFADSAPLLLINKRSVDDINARVEEATISERNFRPNIYIEGPAAYEEDNWDKVYIGEKVVLQNRILAMRCTETTVDPDKGMKNANRQPLSTLKKYRPLIKGDPCFGIFLNVHREGEIKVGDPVYVTKKKS